MKDEIINKTEPQKLFGQNKYTRIFQGGDGLDHNEGGYNEDEICDDSDECADK